MTLETLQPTDAPRPIVVEGEPTVGPLDETVVRGVPAVDWEFEWNAPEGRRHVHSIYWHAQGYEYFVYASSLAERWPQTEPILDVMLSHATP